MNFHLSWTRPWISYGKYYRNLILCFSRLRTFWSVITTFSKCGYSLLKALFRWGWRGLARVKRSAFSLPKGKLMYCTTEPRISLFIVLASGSQTHPWTPRRPEKTQRIFLISKSSFKICVINYAAKLGKAQQRWQTLAPEQHCLISS